MLQWVDIGLQRQYEFRDVVDGGLGVSSKGGSRESGIVVVLAEELCNGWLEGFAMVGGCAGEVEVWPEWDLCKQRSKVAAAA